MNIYRYSLLVKLSNLEKVYGFYYVGINVTMEQEGVWTHQQKY